jgi:large subunit ribosomal protein L17
MIRDKQAVRILFSTIAPRYAERPGGYTRILKLATPRLGDNGKRAMLELVGNHERVKAEKAVKPEFAGESSES